MYKSTCIPSLKWSRAAKLLCRLKMGKRSKKAESLASKCEKMRKAISARASQGEGEIDREGREEIEGEGGDCWPQKVRGTYAHCQW